MLFPNTSEATKEIPWREPGTLSKLYIRVIANSASASSSVTVRKNNADESMTLTIGAGTTGVFEDTVNEVSVAVGDKICIKTVSGGTGTITFSIMSVIFAPTTTTDTVTKQISMGRTCNYF